MNTSTSSTPLEIGRTSTTSSPPRAGWFSRLIHTTADPGAMIARIALGVVMFPHGAQKALGLFGGPGIEGTLGFMTKSGIPMPFAVLAIAAEFLGAIGLVTGLLSRVAAFGVACVMGVAVLMVHVKVGFFMNWMGGQAGEGFEYHVLALGLALVVMVKGGGLFSVDRAISRRRA